jgi:hypothetical protein
MAEKLRSIDAAARMSHRHLLAALGLVLLLAVAALLSLGGGEAARSGHMLWTVLPVITAISAVALRGMSKRVDAAALGAVRKDELRQASLQRAWRNGFLAVLGLQPALALALGWSGAANAAALMAAASASIGAVTVLASLLWYDR